MIHNGLKYYPELYSSIGRALGVNDDEEGVSRLGESYTAVYDPLADPIAAYYRNAYMSEGFASVAAGAAGQFSKILLYNPIGSNCLTLVRSMVVGSGVTQRLVRRFFTQTAAGAPAGWTLVGGLGDSDRRSDRAASCTTIYSLVDNTTPGTRGQGANLLAGTPWTFTEAVILEPGSGVYGYGDTAPSDVCIGFYVLERPLKNRELARA